MKTTHKTRVQRMKHKVNSACFSKTKRNETKKKQTTIVIKQNDSDKFCDWREREQQKKKIWKWPHHYAIGAKQQQFTESYIILKRFAWAQQKRARQKKNTRNDVMPQSFCFIIDLKIEKESASKILYDAFVVWLFFIFFTKRTQIVQK